MIKAILFDLDGTLIDSAPQFTQVLNNLLADAAKPLLKIDQLRPFITGGVNAMVQCAFGPMNEGSALTQLRQAFLRSYADLLDMTVPSYFQGVESVLQGLVERGIPFGLVTNKHQVYAERTLVKTFFKESLACAVYGDTLLTPKPSPEPIFLACRRISVAPQETWFVGDGRVDMIAAQNAKSVAVLAAYGYLEADWRDWPATHVVHQLTDLLTLMDRKA